MKRFVIFLLCICLLWGITPPIEALAVENSNLSQSCFTPSAAQALISNQTMIKNCKSAVLYEANTDTFMYAQNPDQRVYPSSMVKILTAIVAIEKGNLDAQVEATRAALNSIGIGAVSSKIQVGEIMTLRDLLYCMMVDSANDAAAVIAEHIGGSQDGFVSMLNAYAADLGCRDTNFTNATGLHNVDQYTTARDMVRILLKATENATFSEIFGALRYTVPETNKSPVRELETGNYMMTKNGKFPYYDSRVTGGRTGIDQDKTRCLAVSAESNKMKLLAIVFGAESQYAADGYTVEVHGGYQEAETLLETGFEKYKLTQVLFENQVLGQRPVNSGDNDLFLTSSQSCSAILPVDYILADVQYKITDRANNFTAPISAGTVVADVEIWYYGLCLYKSELVSLNDVKGSGALILPPVGDVDDFDIVPILIVVIFVFTAVAFVAIKTQKGKASKRYRRRR